MRVLAYLLVLAIVCTLIPSMQNMSEPVTARADGNTGSAGDTTWQNDFEYSLDKTAGTITCTRYKNAAATSVDVPASAVIEGNYVQNHIEWRRISPL